MTDTSWPGLAPDGLPRRLAFGEPPLRGQLRATPDDFVVDELLGFTPGGGGEHVMLRVEKREANTAWVAGRLAAFCDIPRRDVGFAGLKDRFAVTRQWFSVGLAGRPEPDWTALDVPGVRVLEAVRHPRKLRRGALLGNRFRIRVHDVAGDPGNLDERLEAIAGRGFPNLFGPQRFGRGGANLVAAERLFDGTAGRVRREQRGLLLSAARSLLFNAVAAARLEDGSWTRHLDGEPLVLDGRRGYFVGTADDPELPARLAALEVHPSGPLWGRGGALGDCEAGDRERGWLAPFASWQRGLERFGLEADRRALRVRARELESHLDGPVLELGFTLPAGSFATVLLRELVAAPADAT
ncbi:MAG: tRNA pseudouridine(13) synthase TruD [Gammaproteobacteria bacterium]|nr:tRNA pseudouridine(13) synthase TruD [Gammaproteobacteria bacterium]